MQQPCAYVEKAMGETSLAVVPATQGRHDCSLRLTSTVRAPHTLRSDLTGPSFQLPAPLFHITGSEDQETCSNLPGVIWLVNDEVGAQPQG